MNTGDFQPICDDDYNYSSDEDDGCACATPEPSAFSPTQTWVFAPVPVRPTNVNAVAQHRSAFELEVGLFSPPGVHHGGYQRNRGALRTDPPVHSSGVLVNTALCAGPFTSSCE